jgi:hypothetical protein
VVDAAVVGDAVEPRAHVHLPRVGPQGAERPHEDVLQHVLGVLTRVRAEHLAHVGEEPLPVAVVQDPERVVGARAEQGHELVVRAEAQQRRSERSAAQGRRGVQG